MGALPGFIQERREDIAALCRRHRARRLDLFGSAVREDFLPERSDLDFPVDFATLPPSEYSAAFFELKEELETMFARPVDLLTDHALRNPYLRQRIDLERLPVSGA